MKDILFLLASVVLVVVVGAYIWNAPEAVTLDFRPIDVGGGSITIEDQPHMHEVVLDAELAAPGFITIHETLAGTIPAPADIIGTSVYLPEGEYSELVIPLQTPMDPGYRYVAILHADNGDERFVVADDLPVMVDGAVVRPDFVANPDLEEVE